MKNVTQIMAIALLFNVYFIFNHDLQARSIAHDKVLYGEDNRQLVIDLDSVGDEQIINHSDSVLAQVPNWRISHFNKENFTINTKNLIEGLNICPEENYSSLPIVSSCTAFLVAEDLIVTAGHCIKDKYDCQRQTWLLDYKDAGDFSSSSGFITFTNEQSFTCKELVSHSVGVNLDFALIKLDRPVTGRKPLKLRREGKVDSDENLYMIGHPLGLPKMITSNIKVRDNSLPNFFKTTADAFSGNSGSPVLGAHSGLVEGILIRGEDDFKYDPIAGCQRYLRCSSNDCRGESLLRSTQLPLKKIHN
jgi:Trypsin-like peptidase domain